MKARHLLLALCFAPLAAGCGSGSGSATPTLEKPKTIHVVDFAPAGAVSPGKPFTLSLRIAKSDGRTLTSYKRGAGPHTGVHLIFVRRDLSTIVHLHPPIAADGTIRERVVLPAPGPYLLLLDVYATIPGQPLPNFQLRRELQVSGSYKPAALPPFKAVQVVDGYTFRMTSAPRIKSLSVSPVVVHVTGPDGKPARLTPWFGALAHAIFFRAGTLDYFHTHVCSPDAPNCAGGPASPTTRTTQPGLIKSIPILPLPGVWRVFVQCKVNGHVLTAPYTLRAS